MNVLTILYPVVAELTGTDEINPSITLTGVEYVGGDGAPGDRAPR
jgi:hypothetical protein